MFTLKMMDTWLKVTGIDGDGGDDDDIKWQLWENMKGFTSLHICRYGGLVKSWARTSVSPVLFREP